MTERRFVTSEKAGSETFTRPVSVWEVAGYSQAYLKAHGEWSKDEKTGEFVVKLAVAKESSSAELLDVKSSTARATAKQLAAPKPKVAKTVKEPKVNVQAQMQAMMHAMQTMLAQQQQQQGAASSAPETPQTPA